MLFVNLFLYLSLPNVCPYTFAAATATDRGIYTAAAADVLAKAMLETMYFVFKSYRNYV
jgi:hypothetical protein